MVLGRLAWERQQISNYHEPKQSEPTHAKLNSSRIVSLPREIKDVKIFRNWPNHEPKPHPKNQRERRTNMSSQTIELQTIS